jgi:hypothetical protein
MHPCVIQVNADCIVTGDPPCNVHYFHMFPREDIQTRSFHCPIEDGTAVDKTAAVKLSDGVLLLLFCVESFWWNGVTSDNWESKFWL